MAIHLRQVCTVAHQLAPVIDDLCATFSLEPCHVDPAVGKYGLENTLIAVGARFLEVVAPVREGTAAGRYLDRRGGDGGYMVICQVPTLAEQAAVRARAAETGVRVAHEMDMKTWNIMQLHPGDLAAAFLEVDWDEKADVAGNWMPAGGEEWRPHVKDEVISDITGVELQGEDPDALAAKWAAVCGLPVEREGGLPVVRLADALMRFVEATDGRGPGLSAVRLHAVDAARAKEQAKARGVLTPAGDIVIGGVRFDLRD
ncbi:VOC family protein [Albimonas sp. CAU 1670]|uniref:VOC family protein n=1 Tax=Albimonas sp. CAU 1670 TaxID=3032599 RepID=UPI0023DBD065|nr:VOC family protein [Albimonas sp. CAU 1670]MDF2233647.1 VOC family protein [Albimonas sp. CAU 1670]